MTSSTEVAEAVVESLVRSGVRHVVLCPGGRSAPMAFALYAAQPQLTLHSRIDERSAGFLALGIAKTSRRPVAVVTTSGTATANLHPAVLEAHHCGIPLVALTADRPASLRGTNANQTTDQVRLYGGAVRTFADVGPGEVAAAVVAVAAACAARGPSHVNLQFSTPLTPDSLRRVDPVGTPTPVELTRSVCPTETLDPEPGRTVVVAGDDAGKRARILAEQRGWPLLAEPSSGARTGTHAIRTYRLLLDDAELAARIERVVVCGHPTLSRSVTALISRTDIEVVAVPGALGVTDPGHVVRRVVELGDPTDAPRVRGPWLEEWVERDHDLSRRLDTFLDEHDSLLPHHVAGAVAEALGEGGLLVVGASNPVRDLDLMLHGYRVGGRRMVIANRGLAGIDGTVSTAVGAALGRPHSSRALALLGDVTFLHDSNGLLIGPDEQRPDLMIVVVNDDGGSIFASLEQGAPAYAATYDKLFGTPHGVDLSALCVAYGVPHRRVDSRAGLQTALSGPCRGLEVVEAVVDRRRRRELDAAIREL